MYILGTHQINAQTNYRRDFKSTKEKHSSAVLAGCSPCRHEHDKMRHILTNKNSKVNPSVVTSVLEPNSKRFSKCAIREYLNIKPDPRMKKLFKLTMELYSATQWKKRNLTIFFHFRMKIIWASGPRLVCISKSSSFS